MFFCIQCFNNLFKTWYLIKACGKLYLLCCTYLLFYIIMHDNTLVKLFFLKRDFIPSIYQITILCLLNKIVHVYASMLPLFIVWSSEHYDVWTISKTSQIHTNKVMKCFVFYETYCTVNCFITQYEWLWCVFLFNIFFNKKTFKKHLLWSIINLRKQRNLTKIQFWYFNDNSKNDFYPLGILFSLCFQ